jgi:sporulation protein YlmC with PRC-barrel domain
MENKQYDGKGLEIYDERAIYLANIDEMILKTMEVSLAEKKYDTENVKHGVFEEIELINIIEAAENIGPVKNIELEENLFSKKEFLNVPGNNIPRPTSKNKYPALQDYSR